MQHSLWNPAVCPLFHSPYQLSPACRFQVIRGGISLPGSCVQETVALTRSAKVSNNLVSLISYPVALFKSEHCTPEKIRLARIRPGQKSRFQRRPSQGPTQGPSPPPWDPPSSTPTGLRPQSTCNCPLGVRLNTHTHAHPGPLVLRFNPIYAPPHHTPTPKARASKQKQDASPLNRNPKKLKRKTQTQALKFDKIQFRITNQKRAPSEPKRPHPCLAN
jgi:hypothetical protein